MASADPEQFDTIRLRRHTVARLVLAGTQMTGLTTEPLDDVIDFLVDMAIEHGHLKAEPAAVEDVLDDEVKRFGDDLPDQLS